MTQSWLLAPALVIAPVEAAPPSIPDDSSVAPRQAMVSRQIQARDIRDPRILAAMSTVPRHEMVPKALRRMAYLDQPLSIGYGQTISQPYIVALMTEHLTLKPSDRVLEVGTGSGYQAAILSQLVAKVFTIEIVPELASRAATDLRRLGYRNVFVREGDGYAGWVEHAPFDAIIVTCAPEDIPKPLIDQLKEGGRMVIPMGDDHVQALYKVEKHNGVVEKTSVVPVRFVPMTGRAQAEALTR